MHVLFLPSWYPQTPEDFAGCFFREQAIALSQQGVKVGVGDLKILSQITGKEWMWASGLGKQQCKAVQQESRSEGRG